ncbi:phage virion morphogenesis protein, partial [Salmonella enterica subsp. enterica serovar Corvallis]
AKLRTSRFMKASAGNDAAVVEFTGKVQRMANVHQYGLKDKPGRNSAPVQYDARPLIGFNDEDRQAVEEIIIAKLSV